MAKSRFTKENKQVEVLGIIDDFKAQAIKADDGAAVLKSVGLNYSNGYRATLALEKIILGEIPQSLLGIGGLTAEGLGLDATAEFLKTKYRAHIDYNQLLEKRQENLPDIGQVEDFTVKNCKIFIF